MNSGDCFQRLWISRTSDSNDSLRDTLWVYDGGDIQGFLLERQQGKQDWFLFKIESREYDNQGRIHESGIVLSDDQIPQHFFAIESYPVRYFIQGKTYVFMLPTTQITFSPSSRKEQQHQQQQKHPQQQPLPAPSPPQHQSPSQPVSHRPPKSASHRPSQQQRTPQHKSRAEPKQTSSPSSNQPSHVQQTRQAQELPVRRPPQQHATSRNAPKSQPSLPLSSQPLLSPSSHTHPTQA